MMSMFTKIFLATVAMGGLAAADTPKEKAPVAKDSKPDPGMVKTEVKPEPPKPPGEVDAMAKNVVGNWKCTGTETAMDGSSSKITGKVTAKLDLDKWWINDVVEGKSDKRGGYKMVSYSTFDASSKKWRRISIDNMGTQYVGTSDGMKDGKLVWNMDFLSPLGAGQFKDTVDPSDPKAGVKWVGVMSVDKGKTWKPVYEMTCKK
jgi:hypothetical protein